MSLFCLCLSYFLLSPLLKFTITVNHLSDTPTPISVYILLSLVFLVTSLWWFLFPVSPSLTPSLSSPCSTLSILCMLGVALFPSCSYLIHLGLSLCPHTYTTTLPYIICFWISVCSRMSVFSISLSVSFGSLASLLSAFLSPLLCPYFSLDVSQSSSFCLYCCTHLSLFPTYLSLFSLFRSIFSLQHLYPLFLSLFVGLFALVSLFYSLLIFSFSLS